MSGKTYKELLEQLALAERKRVKQRGERLIAEEKIRRNVRKKVVRRVRPDSQIDTSDIPPLTEDFFRRAVRNPFLRRALKLSPPGKILREEYMKPVGLSPRALANALHVPLEKVIPVLESKRGISAEMAVLLSVYFGTTDTYWINLQAHYDLEVAKEQMREHVARIIPHARAKTVGRPRKPGNA
jgi:addiction module HigA family antidote